MGDLMACCFEAPIDKNLLVLAFEDLSVIDIAMSWKIICRWTICVWFLQRDNDIVIWCVDLVLLPSWCLIIVLKILYTNRIRPEPGRTDKVQGSFSTLLLGHDLYDLVVSLFILGFDIYLGRDQVVKLLLSISRFHISVELPLFADLIVEVRTI